MKPSRIFVNPAALLIATCLPAAAFGQTTALTYQGQLKQSGSPANGSFNMTFKLYDAVAGGAQQGSTLTFDGVGGNPALVSVASGLFTVQLDFGVGPYTANQNRWLEIAVSGVPLAPRQALTPTPFALNTRGVNVSTSGNVGIGTTTPAQKLSVVGTVQSTSGGFMFPDGTTQTTASTGGTGFWSPNGSDIFNNNTGKVGIGTNSPTSLLDVRGYLTLDAGADAAIMTGTGGVELNRYLSLFNSLGFTSASGLKAGGILVSDSYSFANPGKNDLIVKGSVGIGTPTLSYPLTIKTSSLFAGYGWVHTDGTRELGSYVSSSGGWLGTRSAHPLYFFTADSGAQVTLSTAGNLGIGTLNPAAKLDVNGTTRTKILEVVGADVAEKFPVSEIVDPGAVVEIDPDKPGQLRLSHQPYNRRVAGVVSGANGLNAGAILGNLPGDENAPPIALSGRVWVRCDASGGAIAPGDLLTTSATPGHAMKAIDRERSHGAAIGKAMTPLKRGERGLVLVLVNLQ